MVKRLIQIGALLLAGAAIGCGSDDDLFDDGGDTEIEDLEVQDESIDLGEATVIAADFRYDSQEIAEDDSIAVVIKLPPELRFLDGSAEVDGSLGDDEKVGAQVTECSNGTTYLLFNLDRFDLDGGVAPGGADARLTLTVNSIGRGQNIVIEARAETDDVAFGCLSTFIPDEQTVLTVR